MVQDILDTIQHVQAYVEDTLQEWENNNTVIKINEDNYINTLIFVDDAITV